MTFLIIMLVIATIASYIWLYINKNELKTSWWFLIIIAVLHTVIGVLFVKFFALLEVGFITSRAGNMSLYGGIFFMPLFYFIFAKAKKIKLGTAFDIFTFSLVVTLFFARINCLHSGCCLGIEIGNTGYLYPTREIELLYYLIFMLIYLLRRNKNLNNKWYLIYMLSYGITRFIVEWFRQSSSTFILHMGHIWSIVSIIISVILLIIVYRKEHKNVKEEIKK